MSLEEKVAFNKGIQRAANFIKSCDGFITDKNAMDWTVNRLLGMKRKIKPPKMGKIDKMFAPYHLKK